MPRLRELLKGKIPDRLLNLAPTGFDIVGSRAGAVAIVEIPEELEEYKYVIANAVASMASNVRVVLRRIGPRSGEYRLYRYEVLWGSGSTEVIHVENGVRIMLDPVKVFFSPRDQYDRADVAKLVKDGEVIAYLFSGVAPYAFAILKERPRVFAIYAVEINPEAVRYAEVNVRLNKAYGKVIPVEYDAGSFCEKMPSRFDRVLMTLPLGAHRYLRQALMCIKSGGIIHFYHTGPEEEPFSEAYRVINGHCASMGVDCIVVGRRIVREYAPRVYKVRVDFQVLKRG